jgi:hypothetical protein
MRLIDADKLVDRLYDNEFAMLCPLDEVSGVVDACPTVDAEVVVRRKDCKHEFGGSCIICGFQKRKPEDFCSYGERKEVADNG